MLSKHERNYGLGMDALVIVRSGNTNVIMLWVRMLWVRMRWLSHALENGRDYGVGLGQS